MSVKFKLMILKLGESENTDFIKFKVLYQRPDMKFNNRFVDIDGNKVRLMCSTRPSVSISARPHGICVFYAYKNYYNFSPPPSDRYKLYIDVCGNSVKFIMDFRTWGVGFSHKDYVYIPKSIMITFIKGLKILSEEFPLITYSSLKKQQSNLIVI